MYFHITCGPPAHPLRCRSPPIAVYFHVTCGPPGTRSGVGRPHRSVFFHITCGQPAHTPAQYGAMLVCAGATSQSSQAGWTRCNSTELFCSVLFYSVLFYSILFCSSLFYSILSYSIPFHSIPFHSIPFRSVPFCSVLFCSVLFCSVLFCSVLFCSILFLFCSILFSFYSMLCYVWDVSDAVFTTVHSVALFATPPASGIFQEMSCAVGTGCVTRLVHYPRIFSSRWGLVGGRPNESQRYADQRGQQHSIPIHPVFC